VARWRRGIKRSLQHVLEQNGKERRHIVAGGLAGQVEAARSEQKSGNSTKGWWVSATREGQ
jgi:hypothetical protein